MEFLNTTIFSHLLFADGLSLLGMKSNFWTLQVILPVGISFYTFHGLSYVFDIYNNKIKPERNFISYSVFVSFFPLLVAGPIERATHLLPQIIKKGNLIIQKQLMVCDKSCGAYLKKLS